jgi:hypothetical protein
MEKFGSGILNKYARSATLFIILPVPLKEYRQ